MLHNQFDKKRKVESRDHDLLLIKRVNEGDTSAFRTIVEKYKDVSLSLACSILKNQEEAEDALQEAFLKVFKNAHKFRGDSLLSTWLYRIVVNTCLNLKKKQGDRVFEEVSDFKETDQKEGMEILVEQERNGIIVKALEMMKPEESLLLRLYYLCDLKIGEIMEVTDFSESNIKVILYRGRKNMHEILKKIMGKDLTSLL